MTYLAADEETIFIVECKTSKKKENRIIHQKDITEINGIRGNIIPKVQAAFEGKQKIIWLFCTENIILSNDDKARLQEHNIFHLNQDDIRYYEQLIDQLGMRCEISIIR